MILSSLFFGKAFAQTTNPLIIKGEISGSLNEDEISVLSKKIDHFLKYDFLTSKYCVEGWGDEDGPARMQKACKSAQVELLKEVQTGNERWVYEFKLDQASVEQSKIQYSFIRFLKLAKDAPLSCSISVEYSIDRVTKRMSDGFVDFYCDH